MSNIFLGTFIVLCMYYNEHGDSILSNATIHFPTTRNTYTIRDFNDVWRCRGGRDFSVKLQYTTADSGSVPTISQIFFIAASHECLVDYTVVLRVPHIQLSMYTLYCLPVVHRKHKNSTSKYPSGLKNFS